MPGSVYGSVEAIIEWLMGPQNVHGAAKDSWGGAMLPEVCKQPPRRKSVPNPRGVVQAQKPSLFALPSPNGSAAE